ncbi:MAG: hypothetical protein IPJ07_24475 [Acidobacteria bacterium]|nr:hypothetical protein [Acidobacteriota bacterium]
MKPDFRLINYRGTELRVIGFKFFLLLATLCFSYAIVFSQKAPAADPKPSPSPSPSPAADQKTGAGAAAQAELTVDPAEITISTIRGDDQSRSRLISSKGSIKEIRIIPLDLETESKRSVFPASAINIDPQVKAQKSQDGYLLQLSSESMALPLNFKMGNAPSNEYKGEIRIEYEGGKKSVPVTIRIKDRPGPPLLVLLTGILLGIIVTRYREKGKPRDELMVRIGKLRTRINADPELDQNFKSRIEALLIEAGSLLGTDKFEDAGKTMKTAEDIMDKWLKGREDWLSQFKYRQDMMEKVREFGEPASMQPYILAVWRGLEDAGRDASDEDPSKLRKKLDDLSQQLNRYNKMTSMLEKMSSVIDEVDEGEKGDWPDKVAQWAAQLNGMKPDDEATFKTMSETVESAMKEVQKAAAQKPGATAKGSFSFGAVTDGAGIMPGAPSTRARIEEEIKARDAEWRLKLFKRVTFVIAVSLMAAAGFSELYISKPTFGANAWSDYFSLLAWGFGAEATRSSVTELMKTWGNRA